MFVALVAIPLISRLEFNSDVILVRPVPPDVAGRAVVSNNDDSSAAEPDTITFFQFAIV
jgi:hypothetical protein